ncbi:MAG: winged helix-turn-helix domain-containing protein [Candidatus Bathyarchaeia archaeon]
MGSLVDTKNDGSSSHRGNLDIMADILGASDGGTKKTYLMCRCNLSFKQLKNYSSFLIGSGLLHFAKEEANNGTLQITDKGKEFLRAYKNLKALMK